MKLAQMMLILLVCAATGSVFAQDGSGQGPPHVKAPIKAAVTPKKAAQPAPAKATTAKAARPSR
jgi:hypothetical protein